MRDPKRIDYILNLVREVWRLVPDWRLGQLIVNALGSPHNPDPFYVEDTTLEIGLLEIKERLASCQYEEETEDMILAQSDVLRRVLDQAKREPPSNDWERELDEL